MNQTKNGRKGKAIYKWESFYDGWAIVSTTVYQVTSQTFFTCMTKSNAFNNLSEDVIPVHFACKQKLRRPRKSTSVSGFLVTLSETLSLFCHEITPVKVSHLYICDLYIYVTSLYKDSHFSPLNFQIAEKERPRRTAQAPLLAPDTASRALVSARRNSRSPA